MAVAGLLVRSRGALAFLPVAIIRFIRQDIVVTPFPGTELGMTLVAGRVVPVLPLGDEGRALVVCDIEGELIGISGLEPIQSGLFEGDARGPLYEGALIPTLPIEVHLERWRAQR